VKVRPASSFMLIDEAMKHVREFHSRSEFEAFLKAEWLGWKEGSVVTIKKYCFDERIGWDTHLICVDGKAALFSDGPLPEDE
jgi:hypothetical protein